MSNSRIRLTVRTGVLVLAALVAPPALAIPPAHSPCESASDKAAVLETTAEIQAQCNCAGAASHRDFVNCAERVAKQRKQMNLLPDDCINEANRCAKRSTCGRPGYVTCCRTNERGRTRCSVKKDVEKCKAPKHGSATVGQCPSCCQACGGGTCMAPQAIRCCVSMGSQEAAFVDGLAPIAQCEEISASACEDAGGENLGPGECTETTCLPSTTTTTTTVASTTTVTTTSTTTTSEEPTTTTTEPLCGNDHLDPGEDCDPPNEPSCPNPTSPSGANVDCLPDCHCPMAGS